MDCLKASVLKSSDFEGNEAAFGSDGQADGCGFGDVELGGLSFSAWVPDETVAVRDDAFEVVFHEWFK